MGWHHLRILQSRTTAGKAPSGNQIHLFQSVPADLDCFGFYGKELCARVTKLRSEEIPGKDKNGMCTPGFSRTKIRDLKKIPNQTTTNYNLSEWERSRFIA